MTKKRSKLKLILIGGLSLVVVGCIGLAVLVSTFLSKNFIAKEMESKFNCRIEIGEFEASLLSFSPEIELKQLKVTERDSFVNDETPHDERPKLDKAILEVGELKIKVGLFDIISRQLQIETLEAQQIKADVILLKGGRTNLDPLFARVKSEDRSEKDTGKTFNALSNKEFIAKLKDFKISDSELSVRIESSQILVRAENINVNLNEELALDVHNLASMTPTNMTATANVFFFSKGQKVPMGMMELSGGINGIFFDKETADFDPDMDLEMGLGDKSYINRIPVVRGVSDRVIGVDKVPILRDLRLNQWPETILFNEDKTLRCHWHAGQIRFDKKLSMDVGDWTLAVQKDSWIQTGSNNHQFHYKITASESLTQKMNGVISSLVGILPKKTRLMAAEEVKKMVYQDDRFILSLSSQGSFSKPKIKLDTEMPDIKEIGAKLLGDVGSGLLRLLKD